VTAARDHHQRFVANIDDHRLVVQHQRVGLPVITAPRLLEWETGRVLGNPRHLPGDENASVEEEARLWFLDDGETKLLKRSAAGRRQFEWIAAWEHNPASIPELRMDDDRKIHAPKAAGQSFKACSVVEVTVAAHHSLDVRRIDVEPAQVLDHSRRAHSEVEHDPMRSSSSTDVDQHREAVLRDQLIGDETIEHHRRTRPSSCLHGPPADRRRSRRVLWRSR
jgi:hypothetical protein